MKPDTIFIWLTAWAMAVAVAAPAGAAALTDPTRPYGSGWQDRQRGQTTNRWVLNSTLVSPQRRVAVINGTHVTEGETIGTATVLKIRQLDVLLQAHGKRITLQLLPDIVKK